MHTSVLHKNLKFPNHFFIKQSANRLSILIVYTPMTQQESVGMTHLEGQHAVQNKVVLHGVVLK